MEKIKLSHNPKSEPLKNKEKVGDKIDSIWNDKSSFHKNSKYETKKLIIKLETSGMEKRKISLKLESGSHKVTSSNYTLISELIKEFFNGSSTLK